MDVQVPESYRAMPRWWSATSADRAWLAALPRIVGTWCERWSLTVDGPLAHGSHAVVVPVRVDDAPAALRVTPPSQDVRPLVEALTFWHGCGTVALLRSDDGALLMERLSTSTLADRPLAEATTTIGRLARRMSVAVPAQVSARLVRTDAVVAERTPQLRPAWARRGGSLIPAGVVLAAEAAADLILATSRPAVAVNADLHFAQVLQADDGGWRVVDPVLQVGDAERTVVEVLWHRVDELEDAQIRDWFAALVDAADLDPMLAKAWARWRVVDYALWGLDHGLTQDPARCARLATALG